MKVYLVLHHEILPNGKGYRADEMVFYVVSSMRKALDAIRQTSVDPSSWWEIQAQVLDDPHGNWPEHVGYYGRRGGRLSKPPYNKAVALFKKHRVDVKRKRSKRNESL